MDDFTRNLLMDMRTYADYAVEFTEGRTRTELETDLQLQLAVIRAIEIVGEAASKVPTAFQAKHADIPWTNMIGMRHRLIHGYGKLNYEIIYDTARNYLPQLIGKLDVLLKGKS